MGYIYVIENDVNDKIYVGKTTDALSNRFSKHCWEAINQP
jgi:predicted GIY-YIG superfamily endonuclease